MAAEMSKEFMINKKLFIEPTADLENCVNVAIKIPEFV